MENASSFGNELNRILQSEADADVVLNLDKVSYFDSAGIVFLLEIGCLCRESGRSLTFINAPDRVEKLLEGTDFDGTSCSGALLPRTEPNLVVQIGDGAVKVYRTMLDILTFIGASIEGLLKDLLNPRTMRWDGFLKLVERSGADAIPIVTVLSFLMGAILAFQAAIQLRKFGANIFVADLVSLSICLEMGPLLTALIVAGRSGAAYAAHIGTMQVNEEVDALVVMGVDPIRYLVSPRIVAVAFVLPGLVLVADIVGIVGGCFVAGFSLDLTPTAYFNQVKKVLEISDVLKGLTKSFFFGVEVAMIGCIRGFQVRGGAENVGRYTTSAVVTCIFVLTITDALFSMLFYYAPSIWKM